MTSRDERARRAGPVAGEGGALRAGHGPSSTPPSPTPSARDASVVWHEVECGGYSADLALWEELADDTDGAILDLGCGTGRVALHLARRGHRVVGLDLASSLVADLERRAQQLPVDTETADARDFDLDETFASVLAPMQLVQLFASSDERIRCLRRVAAHLTDGGLAAFAIVESMPEPVDGAPPLPDTREIDGWVYSSLPVETAVDAAAIRIRRLRQTVSPAGALSEEVDEVILQRLDAETLEREGEGADLEPAGRRAIPATDAHVASTVVLLQRGA